MPDESHTKPQWAAEKRATLPVSGRRSSKQVADERAADLAGERYCSDEVSSSASSRKVRSSRNVYLANGPGEEETGGCWWLLVETAGSGARAVPTSRRLRLRPGCGGRPRPPRRGTHRSNGQSRVRGRGVADADGRRHDLSLGLDDEADRRRVCDDAGRGLHPAPG